MFRIDTDSELDDSRASLVQSMTNERRPPPALYGLLSWLALALF